MTSTSFTLPKRPQLQPHQAVVHQLPHQWKQASPSTHVCKRSTVVVDSTRVVSWRNHPRGCTVSCLTMGMWRLGCGRIRFVSPVPQHQHQLRHQHQLLRHNPHRHPQSPVFLSTHACKRSTVVVASTRGVLLRGRRRGCTVSCLTTGMWRRGCERISFSKCRRHARFFVCPHTHTHAHTHQHTQMCDT